MAEPEHAGRLPRLRVGRIVLLVSLLSGVSAAACNEILGNVEAELQPDAARADARPHDATLDARDGGIDARDAAKEARDALADALDALDATEAPISCATAFPDASFLECVPEAGMTSLAMNPNCGACGHDCRGGSCNGGLCGSVPMLDAAPLDLVDMIGSVGGDLYWAEAKPDGLEIRTMPRDDGGSPRTLTVIATDGGYLYGGGAVDDSGVYYYYTDPLLSSSLERVGRAGAKTILNNPLPMGTLYATIALDEVNAYVSDQLGRVAIVPKDGSDAAPFPSSSSVDPEGLVVGGPGGRVSWLSVPWLFGDGGGTLVSYGGGPSTEPILIELEKPSGLAERDGWFYFFDNVKAELQRLPEGVDAAVLDGNIGGGPEGGSIWTWLPEGGLGFNHNYPCVVLGVDSTRAFAGVANFDSYYDIVEFSMCGREPRLRTVIAAVTGNIVADETFLYWGVYGGQMYRMVR
jgi:hypothetical protein